MSAAAQVIDAADAQFLAQTAQTRTRNRNIDGVRHLKAASIGGIDDADRALRLETAVVARMVNTALEFQVAMKLNNQEW